MRVLFIIGVLLALAAPLYAETYSWVDDSGTFHFTEDYSGIPKKYRNKVQQRDDISPEQTQAPAKDGAGGKAAGGESSKSGASGGKTAAKPDDSNQQLFGGKTEDAWRNELALQEQELHKLEGTLQTLQKQAVARGLSREQFTELKKEYDETRATYSQKYEDYSKQLEAAKKAGLRVEMKK